LNEALELLKEPLNFEKSFQEAFNFLKNFQRSLNIDVL
jgi:hypothetical protein